MLLARLSANRITISASHRPPIRVRVFMVVFAPLSFVAPPDAVRPALPLLRRPLRLRCRVPQRTRTQEERARRLVLSWLSGGTVSVPPSGAGHGRGPIDRRCPRLCKLGV